MLSPFSLEGETAVITGGGTGLGYGIAASFVQAGAKVALVGRRADVLERAAKELGDAAIYEQSNVDEVEKAEELIGRLQERMGSVSILVNNAGIHLKKSAVDTTPAEFTAVLQTHLVAAFSLSRAALPGMIEKKHGNILFTASMATLFGIPYVVAYASAKSAFLGLVRTLATEVSGQGVRVNAIAPGWIEFDMLKKSMAGDPERARKVLERTPMKRFGTAQDIGLAATYLCSPAAQFVTGVILPVDGGVSIGF